MADRSDVFTCDRNCSHPLQQTLTNTQSCSTPSAGPTRASEYSSTPRDQHDNHSLSEEARHAKHAATSSTRASVPSDWTSIRQAGLYLSACSAACDSILRSRADRITQRTDSTARMIPNSTKYWQTLAPPGERHRIDCFTASTRPLSMTSWILWIYLKRDLTDFRSIRVLDMITRRNWRELEIDLELIAFTARRYA